MQQAQLKQDIELLVDGIVADFARPGPLPHESLQAAADNWEEVLPEFLDMIEAYVRHPGLDEVIQEALFLVVHLFGQMRETRAYRPTMRLLALAPRHVEAVLGDAIGETLPRIAINLFDGDPGPIRDVIGNPGADQFVRGGLLEALAYLARDGRLDRDEMARYLLNCYAELHPQSPNFLWVGWQRAVAYLGLAEFRSLVRKAFARGMIEAFVMRYEDFEEDLRRALAGAGADPDADADLRPFGTVAEELAGWHCFTEKYRLERERRAATRLDPYDPPTPQPYVNVLRHVGRNDPCPCGSGQKFKRCCLQ